jgi:hypothetical protein
MPDVTVTIRLAYLGEVLHHISTATIHTAHELLPANWKLQPV